MKKILVLVISVFLGLFSIKAQNLENFFAKQKANKDVEYTKLPKEAIKTMNLVAKFAAWASEFKTDIPKEDAKVMDVFSEILDDVEEFRFVISKNDKVNLQKEFKKSNIVKANKYKLLGKKLHKTQDVIVYGQKTKCGTYSNIIVVLVDKDDKATIIANAKGKIQAEKVAKMIALGEEKTT